MSFMGKCVRALVATALLGLGGAAQGAIVYDLNYDPVGFVGFGQLSIDSACLSEDGTFFSSSESCPINLLFDNTHGSNGSNWSSGFLFDIADGKQFDVVNGELVRFDSDLLFLTFDGFDNPGFAHGLNRVSSESECGDIQFFRGDNQVAFNNCDTLDTGTYRLSRAPEPESLALVFGALGAAWIARRRRPRQLS